MSNDRFERQKQDSLPFPEKRSGSTAGRTMQELVYSPSPAEKHLPNDAPNILIVLIDDAGPGLPTTFGGEVTTKTMDRIVEQGHRLQPLPYHRHVLAYPRVTAHRPESSPCRQRTNCRTGK